MIVSTAMFKEGLKAISRNSPMVLSAVAVVGVGTTAYLAAKASPKAEDILEDKERALKLSLDYVEGQKIKIADQFRYTWRLYVPAVLSGVMTVSAIIFAQRINMRKQAAVASAYMLSEKALSEYRDKVTEILGEKKAEKIEDAIVDDRIKKSEAPSVVIISDNNQLCYDGLTGRYFESNIEKMKQAVNNFNRDVLTEGFKTENEFFDYLGLPYVDTGNDIGWDEMTLVDVHFGTHLSPDNKPCISMDHRRIPGPPYGRR